MMKVLSAVAMFVASSIALSAIAAEPPANFLIHEAPTPLALIDFADGDGRPRTLADFEGKTILLNIWATWCTSCRREMPALDRLQAELGGPVFEVVALSIDRGGPAVVRDFYAELGIKHLALYIDESGKANRQFGLVGLPTTLLVDDDGREIGRLIGPAEWDSPDIVGFIRSQISRNQTEPAL